jgi:hypothetical protein
VFTRAMLIGHLRRLHGATASGMCDPAINS